MNLKKTILMAVITLFSGSCYSAQFKKSDDFQAPTFIDKRCAADSSDVALFNTLIAQGRADIVQSIDEDNWKHIEALKLKLNDESKRIQDLRLTVAKLGKGQAVNKYSAELIKQQRALEVKMRKIMDAEAIKRQGDYLVVVFGTASRVTSALKPGQVLSMASVKDLIPDNPII